MAITTLVIPGHLTFADLRLCRLPSGDVSFDLSVVSAVCQASGLPDLALAADEDTLASFVVAWYHAHLARGGAPDPVAQDLIGEVEFEERLGQTVSLPPGHA